MSTMPLTVGQLYGVDCRRQHTQGSLGSFLVVFPPLVFDFHPSVGEPGKPVLFQAFVSQVTVGRFDIRVKIHLSRLDQLQVYAVAICPSQHRLSSELPAVVGLDDLRLASQRLDLHEQSGQACSSDAVLRIGRYCFERGVVDDR